MGLRATSIGALVVFAIACRPGNYTYYEETDLILSIQEPGRDFSQFQTYGLWPEVQDLSDIAEDAIDINHGVVDPVLLDAVQANMDDAGWTQVADPQADNPDVVAVIGVVASNNWYFYSYYYWYDYYWWYYPGYYPPYYPGGYVVNYPSGSVIVMLMRPQEQEPPDADGNVFVPIIWTGVVWGELSDSSSSNLDRMVSGIDQAFVQSPYLDR